MKVLFVHNIRMKRDERGNLYTHSSYNDEVWERYLSISGNLSVMSRKEAKIYQEDYAHRSFQPFNSKVINNIEVINLTNSISSFLNLYKRKKNKKIIEEAVIDHDLIIARLPCGVGYEAIKLAKKHNKPYLIEVVACTWDSLWNHSLKGKILAPYSYFRLKNYVKSSLYVVYVTNQFLQKRYPTKGLSTNCSNVTLDDFDDNVLRRRINHINQEKEKLIIGTTAALNVRFKGQQYVIKALGKLKEQGITNFEYQLVGGGDDSYLRSIAQKYGVSTQVKFLGSMSRNEVFKWLETIDIYAQPSKQEGLPRALIEAMSKGLPAFGAKTGGIPELIDNEYIFSNNYKNKNEICKILKGFNVEIMQEQASHNYLESKKYTKAIINKRREQFYRLFKQAH